MKATELFFLSFFLVSSLAGYIWPQPSYLARGASTITINPNFFSIQATPGSETQLLTAAITRYTSLCFPFPTNDPNPGTVQVLNVTVQFPEANPDLQLGVDESYSLNVDLDGTSTLLSSEIWGALRGLESFSQLIDFDAVTMKYSIGNASISVTDEPRFAWRGLMIDTARHYLSPDTIYRTIDALAYNKFNTLHWHTVDAQAFTMQSLIYPNLTQYGAYHPTLAIYPQDVVADIVAYGYERGIRVVPEFDIPGHAYSWGRYYPVVAQCPQSYAANINNYPLDPSNDFTFELVENFLGEMSKLFIDKTLHLGGDEVVYSCWTQNSNVSNWMNKHGFKNGNDVLAYFETQFQQYATQFQRSLVVWQEVFQSGAIASPDTIVEVWQDLPTLQSVVNAGYRGILAAGWYLDKQVPLAGVTHYEWIDTWQDFYNNEPLAGVTSNPNLVIGGEAAMWGEQVDDTCFDERVWPRASAIAERLWSPRSVTDINDAKNRMIDLRCRMARRGINGGPVAPDYCPLSLTPPAGLRSPRSKTKLPQH